MKKQDKENQEKNSVKITEILSDEEINTLKKYYDCNQWNEARRYLNEEERKKELHEKGILADYLFYYLFYIFSDNKPEMN